MKGFFDITGERVCELINISDKTTLKVTCYQGDVLTGKQRVRQWCRTELELNGETLGASDSMSLIATLRQLAEQCLARGYYLNVVGLLPEFSESGLSQNTGYGYVANEVVHMLDTPGADRTIAIPSTPLVEDRAGEFYTKLQALKSEVLTTKTGRVLQESDPTFKGQSWGGAGAMVISEDEETVQSFARFDGFKLITRHAKVIGRLYRAFPSPTQYNYISKYEFWGGVTQAGVIAVQHNPSISLKDLVDLLVDAAIEICRNWDAQSQG